jgi:AAA family ATP:ADP antiporter
MSLSQPRNPLEKLLNLFTEVKPGEGVTAFLLFLNLFTLLTAYYMMKTVREALILVGGGAEVKSYAAAGQALLLLGAVPLYSFLASKLSRRKLINAVTIFFSACLGLFYILAQFEFPLGVIFYLWVGIFSLMVIAQFWAFANDIYSPEEGKRLFVIVAFGASAGSVFGSFLAGLLVKPIGVYQLLLVSGFLLLFSLILTNIIDSRSKTKIKESNTTQSIDEPLDKTGAYKLLFQSKYLLLIAFLLFLLNWVNTTGEYILGRTVSNAAIEAVTSGKSGGLTEGQYIGKFYADFFTIVNLVGVLTQLFIVSRILKFLGVKIALLVLPVIAFGGYFIMAFFPLLSAIRWAKTVENSTDYSLQNTVRQVLFLPTTREEKYKAKQAIDTLFVRAGDVLSALVVYLGTTYFAFQIKQFALFNICLVFVWIIISIFIGIEYKKLVNKY